MTRDDVLLSIATLVGRLRRGPTAQEVAEYMEVTFDDMKLGLDKMVKEKRITNGDGYYQITPQPIAMSGRVEVPRERKYEPPQPPEEEKEDDTTNASTEETGPRTAETQEETRDAMGGGLATPPVRSAPAKVEDGSRKLAKPQPSRKKASVKRLGLPPGNVRPGGGPQEEPAAVAKITSKLFGWQTLTIRAVMGTAGVAAAIVAGYFTVLRLGSFMPRLAAAICGFFMVAFSVVAFETCLYYVQRRRRAMAGLFVLLWAVVWIFTLQATVAGFYNFYSKVRLENAKVDIDITAGTALLRNAQARATEASQRVREKEAEIASLQRIVEDASTSVERRAEYGRVFYDAENRLATANKDLDRLQTELQAARTEETRVLASAPAAVARANRTDFYEWAGELLRVRPEAMELASAMFPSVFIDLIASVGLAVALFLI